MPDEITFLATLPDIASAITFNGGRDGFARVKLDLPGTEADAALLLAHHGRARLLEVTVKIVAAPAQPEPESNEAETETKRAPARRDLRRSANGRDQRAGK